MLVMREVLFGRRCLTLLVEFSGYALVTLWHGPGRLIFEHDQSHLNTTALNTALNQVYFVTTTGQSIPVKTRVGSTRSRERQSLINTQVSGNVHRPSDQPWKCDRNESDSGNSDNANAQNCGHQDVVNKHHRRHANDFSLTSDKPDHGAG